MVLALEHLGTPFYLATMVVPVALYFLVLGLLNSRAHPQLLTGRQDMVILTSAMSPLVLFPLVNMGGATAVALLLAVVGAWGAYTWAFGRQNRAWVIYNLPSQKALDVIERSVEHLGLQVVRHGSRLELPAENACIQISMFPLLRNTSLRLKGGSDDLARRLNGELSSALAGISAQTTTMAMGLLLVATAMLVAPIATIVHRAPEMVRVLTDLIR